MFGLGERSLVLVPSGEVFGEVAGFDGEGMILWIRGETRRLYGERAAEGAKLWDGALGADERAREARFEFRERAAFAADFAAALSSLDEIHVPFSEAAFAASVVGSIAGERRFRRGGIALRDFRHRLGERKLRKTAVEIEALRRAARASAEAHRALMTEDWRGRRELDVAMRFDLELRRRGIAKSAYETIVGAGDRALVLHARAGGRLIANGDLILVDAAGLHDGLCADVTRTFPASGRFSAAQRTLYEIVLRAQKRAIAMTRPGTTMAEIDAEARRSMAEDLARAGWLKDAARMDEWFPHRTGHWLGRQVHDRCPSFEDDGSPIRLEEGMVFTIEPGLYLRGDDAPAEARGLGVRIEDDVVVTKDGCEVLSAAAPKEVDEIEELRRTAG